MISQNKYVAITSGVGGQAAVSAREPILRLYTTNNLMPTGTVLEFQNAAGVGDYFGFNSREYAIAQRYFGFVSSQQQSPSKISFCADISNGKAPFVRASSAPALLSVFQSVKDGAFTLSMAGLTAEISGLDFSSAKSYADVAQAVQTKIRAAQTASTMWTGAVFAFDAEQGVFTLTGGEVAAGAIVALTAGTGGTDISPMLKMDQNSAPVVSQGVGATAYGQMLSESLSLSNNYGTFAFLNQPEKEAIVQIAQWTQAQNLAGGMYLQPVAKEDYQTVQKLVKDFSGTALIADAFTPYSLAWLVPACVAAATNFNRVNGTQNYMYKQLSGVESSVNTDSEFDALTAARVNFYGSTQQAGTQIAFFQPGSLQGDVEDMGVFMNELWLKDAATVEFLNYQLAVSKWPANSSGKAIGDGLLQGVIERAKKNGTIAQGKALTSTQKAYITSLTGDEDAWLSVYSEGYYLYSQIVPVTTGVNTVYEYQYTLVYSKGDSVRKVTGTHTLI
nr:MAG TPA: tail sheath protein [Caudoviricetes sp.]